MPERLLITNCRLFDRPAEKKTISILMENGIISRIGQIKVPAGFDNILDAGGRIVAPGFIDVHIQGAGGADILDGTAEGLRVISETCVRFGTTSFLGTTVFKPNGENRHISLAGQYVNSDIGGARLLGFHLEGPFISLKKKGMIQPDSICPPSVEVLDRLLDTTAGHLKLMTIAPELPGSLEIIRALVDSDITASFGHSSATYEETLAGFEAGISHVTHLFNAMTPLHHRSPGPLAAIFETKKITAQVIADGVHIHPSVLKLAFKTLGAARTILITDGMQALGLADGKYIYNGVEYTAKEGAARYKDGTLIGTTLGLSQQLRNPAKLLGIEQRKGYVGVGKDADLVVLEKDCSVHTTIVAGRIVYQK